MTQKPSCYFNTSNIEDMGHYANAFGQLEMRATLGRDFERRVHRGLLFSYKRCGENLSKSIERASQKGCKECQKSIIKRVGKSVAKSALKVKKSTEDLLKEAR